MTAQAESAPVIAETRAPSSRRLFWRGVRAGLLGAATIAVWFLFVDYGRDRPFHTPNLLGTLIVGAGGVLPPALSFSVVHTLVFVVIGVVGARFFAVLEEGGLKRLGIAALLLFIILNLGFSSFALTARAIGLEALSWPDVLIGNALAAAAMIVYLRRPLN